MPGLPSIRDQVVLAFNRIIARWITFQFRLSNSFRGFAKVPGLVIEAGAKSAGWESSTLRKYMEQAYLGHVAASDPKPGTKSCG